MARIGVFFGTDTGTTRLIAKKMAKKLGEELAAKPVNVNRIRLDDMLNFDALIFGTPTYGDGQPPGVSTGVKEGSWEEFLPKLAAADLSGKRIALYGLGNQVKYPDCFADGLRVLYEGVSSAGATVVGEWSTQGYEFSRSRAVVADRFVGLILDQHNQALQTEQRIDAWLEQILPALLDETSALSAMV